MFKLKVKCKESQSVPELVREAGLLNIAKDIENVNTLAGVKTGKISLSPLTTLFYSYKDKAIVFQSHNPLGIMAHGGKNLYKSGHKCLTNASHSLMIKEWWEKCGVLTDDQSYISDIGVIKENYTFDFLHFSPLAYLVLGDGTYANCTFTRRPSNNKNQIAVSYVERGNIGEVINVQHADYTIEPHIYLMKYNPLDTTVKDTTIRVKSKPQTSSARLREKFSKRKSYKDMA